MRKRLELLLFPLLLLLVAGCGRRVDPRAAEGYELVKQGKTDEAVAFVNAILADEPENAQIRNILGLALYKSGDAEGSVEQYLRALEDDPGFPEAHFNLGNSLQVLGRVEEAEAQFSEAVRLQKKFVLARYNLGKIRENSGRTDEALAEYRRCVKDDPQFTPAFLDLGLILAASGDVDAAIPNFERVLELDPTFKQVRVHLGNAYLRSEREGGARLAENEFRAAVGIDPTYLDAVYSLGVALISQSRTDEAIEWFEKALEISAATPDHPIHRKIRAYFEEIGHTPAGKTASG